jgi:hypothetical protein
MFMFSLVGAAAGVYYGSLTNPLNNYFVFLAVFALIGVAVANVALLILDSVYRWLKKYYADEEQAEIAQTSCTNSQPEAELILNEEN